MRLSSGFRFRWSIVTVFTVSMVLIISLLMALTTLLEVRRERAIFRAHLEEKSLLLAGMVNEVVADSPGSLDDSDLNRITTVAMSLPEVSYLGIFSSEGELVGGFWEGSPGATVIDEKALDRFGQSQSPELQFMGDTLDVTSPLTADEMLIGVVNFGFDGVSLQAEIRRMAIESLLQALVLIALAAALSYLIARRIARPVKQLARAAEDVGKGTFPVSVPVDDRRSDEVGELARAFAAMTQALQESRERLEKSVQDERQQAAELARANEANLEMMRELELAQERNIQSAKMAAIWQLAGGVAHEINNPLASILGFAQLGLQKLAALRNKPVEPKDIAFLERYLGYVESEAKRSAQIISKMLSFTTSPGREMHPANINQLLKESLAMNTNQLAVPGIKVEMRLIEGDVRVDAHTASLMQAFNNIVSNGIIAMPEGGTLTVTTQIADSDAFAMPPAIEMKFEDTGIGIPPENISKVFEPFFTTAEPGQGTGLGMYVCYQVIKQHGGDIEISSRQGQGTTVTIRLPISSAEEEADAADE